MPSHVYDRISSKDEYRTKKKYPGPSEGVERWALAWVGGTETGDEPKSCFNCPFLYINQKRCQIHGPDITIDTCFKDGQLYTPVCVYQTGGTPRAVEDSQVVYNATILGKEKAELSGLEWSKGPGTNCGGFAGAADCEHFFPTDSLRINGLCGLMRKGELSKSYPLLAAKLNKKLGKEPDIRNVDWDDCCNGHEGEHISWQEAQTLLKTKSASEKET